MEIIIKEKTCTILNLNTDSNIKIIEIKQKIEEIYSYPIRIQHLFFYHEELKNEYSLKDYNLNKDITLTLIVLHI